MVLDGLLYTEDHEWIKIEDDTATAGITDYAQDIMGVLNFIELPDLGRECIQNDEIGVLESSKASTDFHAPITAQIIEVNLTLQDNPEIINDDCYGDGWICKFKLNDESTFSELMDFESYEQYLKEIE